MPLLIDGYNLLNVTGIVGRGVGPGTLDRSRKALLNFIAESIDPAEVPQTTVVFDAHDAPPGLPRTVTHHGITVHYASDYEDADELIEELIQAHSAPRSLTVVSSDHRIHRAAKRRKAQPIDSDRWYAETIRRRAERGQPDAAAEIKPQHKPSPEEVERWLKVFDGKKKGDMEK